MSNWKNFISVLKDTVNTVVLVHEKPDGDCLGSALALCQALDNMKIKPVLLLPEKLPSLYSFLPGQQYIDYRPAGKLDEGLMTIAVDCAEPQRIPYEFGKNSVIINIDHHISNTNFGHLNIVDPEAAATSELLYRMFEEGDIEITRDMATCMYVALSTDTGSFSYSNTTSETLKTAGELLSLGVDIVQVRSKIHENRPFKELLLAKLGLNNIIKPPNKKIIASFLSYEDLKKHDLLTADTDGLMGMIRATEGVEIAVLFKEVEPETVKVSLRSKSYADVNELACGYGGGGHSRAAGCTLKGNLNKIVEEVLEKAGKYDGSV